MLRITAHDNPRLLTLGLEGRLEGLWVTELKQCWREALTSQSRPKFRVDLSGVTFIDDAGKACLAAMYEHGAELVAADCLIKAMVEEITDGRSSI